MPPRHPDIARALGPVRATLERARQADEVDAHQPYRVLVGCSGGRDSVALLGLLAVLRDAERLQLSVGHIDHGLRPDSAEDADRVCSLADALGVPFAKTCPSLPRAPAGLPARARAARHAALRTMRAEQGMHRIALAHTATDQAETMLLHLARGAGLRGLSAMAAVEPEIPVLRPLLTVPRSSTATLCERLGLSYVDDPTNDDLDHPRVRVRKVVLPALDLGRGGVDMALAAAADVVREADEALSGWAERECKERSVGAWDLDVRAWMSLPRAIRIAVLREFVRIAGVAADAIGRRTLDAIDAGIGRGGAKQWTLAGDVALILRNRTLRVDRSERVRTPPGEGP